MKRRIRKFVSRVFGQGRNVIVLRAGVYDPDVEIARAFEQYTFRLEPGRHEWVDSSDEVDMKVRVECGPGVVLSERSNDTPDTAVDMFERVKDTPEAEHWKRWVQTVHDRLDRDGTVGWNPQPNTRRTVQDRQAESRQDSIMHAHHIVPTARHTRPQPPKNDPSP